METSWVKTEARKAPPGCFLVLMWFSRGGMVVGGAEPGVAQSAWRFGCKWSGDVCGCAERIKAQDGCIMVKREKEDPTTMQWLGVEGEVGCHVDVMAAKWW